MAGMLTQLPLPLLPAGAAEIAPGVGLVAGDDGGGLVSVHGLATFAWDAGDEAGRRLAAVQLVRLRAASQAQAAAAFGVDPVTVWRWDQALASGGVAELVPSRRGPKGASKLTPQLTARIGDLDAAGATLSEIAAATGVSTFSVRNALGRVPSGGRSAAGAAEGSAALAAGVDDAGQGPVVPVLPDPVPREAERALARWGLLGEGAVPVFTPGARYPLAGLLLALPALEGTGLLDAARQVYGRLRGGFYGLGATLLTLVFLALAGEPRAEGATRVPPAALGRVLGLDRAPEVKTIRRKLGELAAAGKAADLIMALARRHAAARPDTLGFLHIDGHARVYYGIRDVQKTHVARLKFPAPATMETWVTGRDGDPVFMVLAEPSDSLAGELRRLLPDLRAIAGRGRRVTVCFDRGGWSPALFADITAAGFDLLTWRKGPAPDVPAGEFTTITCTDDRGREHRYDLADTTVVLGIGDGPRKGQTVSLRQVTRHVPARGGGTRQIHALTSRTDLTAGEVCWRLTSRWREENYFRYARTHFALDALDSYAATPDDPDRKVPQPGQENRRRPGPPGRDPRRRGPGPARRHPGRPAQPPARPAGHHHQPDDQRPGRPRPSRPPRTRRSGHGRSGHPVPGPARHARPGHDAAGSRGQADHPRHPDGRLQRPNRPGPRPGRPLRPRRRRSIRPHPRSPHRLRRHPSRPRPAAHPARPAHRTPAHPGPSRPLRPAQPDRKPLPRHRPHPPL
jgi:hypothetical protein